MGRMIKRGGEIARSQELAAPGGRGLAFGALLAGAAAVCWLVLRPMIYGVAWGVFLGFLWHPVHGFISARARLSRSPNLAAALSMLLLIVCITLPVAGALQAVASELLQAYRYLFDTLIPQIRTNGLSWVNSAAELISSLVPEALVPAFENYALPFLSDKERIASTLASIGQSAASMLHGMSSGVILGTGAFLFQAVIALLTLFFALRDGPAAARFAMALLPLRPDERGAFSARLGGIMHSVVYGTLLTVAIQAGLAGAGWAVAGLENAFLASAVMFIVGMFPFGMAIVWLPGGIYLLASGSYGAGIGLLLWGALVVSTIDSFLRPIFVGRGEPIPTLAIVLGVTGGLAFWGLLGAFLGPISLAVFLCLLERVADEPPSISRPGSPQGERPAKGAEQTEGTEDRRKPEA